MSPFREVTQTSSYWAGFLQTDGSLRKTSEHLQARITLQLKATDKEHVGKFANFIGFRYPLRWVDNHGYGAWRIDMYKVEEHLEALKNNFRVEPDKGTRFQNPGLGLENSLAFLIGMIDGDGSVIWRYNKPFAVQVFGTLDLVQWSRGLINNFVPPVRPNRIKPMPSKLKNGFLTRLEGVRAASLVKIVQDKDVPLLRRKWFNELPSLKEAA